MKFYWIKTNALIKRIYAKYIWDIPTDKKKVYLTFDDGPTPEVTKWTLAQLKTHHAKATFFCIGDNIKKYPEIFQEAIKQGHAIGNHTFNHLNGWKTSTKDYIENCISCSKIIVKTQNCESSTQFPKLFRPPYGKIKSGQANKLMRMGYKIIMWDILSADFDQAISPEKCLENVLSNIKSGSIIVFHDSVKSFKNLEHALPKTLDFINKNGYTCHVLL